MRSSVRRGDLGPWLSPLRCGAVTQIRCRQIFAYGSKLTNCAGTAISTRCSCSRKGRQLRGLHEMEDIMNYVTHTLAMTGLVAALGTGAFAQDVDPATLTCGDFLAMSGEDQGAAMDALKAALTDASSASAASTDTAASTESAASTEAASSDTASSDTAATTESDSASSADPTGSEDALADPQLETLVTSCEGNDEAMVMDQMGSM